jgi:hypothetical protein
LPSKLEIVLKRIALVVIFLFCAWQAYELFIVGRIHSDGGAPAERCAALASVAEHYNIKIINHTAPFSVKIFHGTIDGQPPDAERLQNYVPLFQSEFTIYPRALIEHALLKRVVLCEDLAFEGQRRSAVPDFEHDTLYLDVARGTHQPQYQRKVIHHEFFHIIDYRDDGQIYTDERWSSLNRPDFKYGTGGKFAQDQPDTGVLTEKFPGFLNHYSTTGVQEDKAEIFAYMIVEPTYIAKRTKTDPVLKAKVQRMRELLADFCPEMDEEFWTGVAARRK